jgi:hypothetical protein
MSAPQVWPYMWACGLQQAATCMHADESWSSHPRPQNSSGTPLHLVRVVCAKHVDNLHRIRKDRDIALENVRIAGASVSVC